MCLLRVMNMWDERYKVNETVYGTQPNVFWASQISLRTSGSLCLPCEGEGRNAVWAAQCGWDVTAFDLSEVGVRKTKDLAKSRGVHVDVAVADALSVQFDSRFDVVGLIFAHMPQNLRQDFHQRAWTWVKPGGHLVVEGFHRDQLGRSSGGPKQPEMLFDETTFGKDVVDVFDDATLIWNARCEQVLDEGPFHQGHAITVQVVIQKRSDD